MASGQTTNFGLNQWTAEDKVIRTEFNEDNVKIDAALAAKGNCCIVTGSYVGTGTYKQYGPNSLSFEGKPLVLFVQGSPLQFITLYGRTQVGILGGYTASPLSVTWDENTITWQHGDSANLQLNQEGVTYHYVALLATD